MLSSLRKCHQCIRIERFRLGVIVASSAALMAGCSADIARFDLGNPEGARAHSDYAPTGTTGRSTSSEYGSAGYDRSPYRGETVSRSELPRPQEPMTTAAIPPEQPPRNYEQDRNYGQGQPSSGYGGVQQQRAAKGQPGVVATRGHVSAPSCRQPAGSSARRAARRPVAARP